MSPRSPRHRPGTSRPPATGRPHGTSRRPQLAAGESDHLRANRRAWDRVAGQEDGPAPGAGPTWGWWRWPEDELRVLGEVTGKKVLDIGCGGAGWTVALARRGAEAVGLDSAAGQLDQAHRVVHAAELDIPLVLGDAEQLPFRDESFDIVGCDWGALGFADPYRSVPEAARVLRPQGILAFSISSPLGWLCSPPTAGIYAPGTTLQRSYFELRRWVTPDGMVHFQLPYGTWIRLFRRCGLIVEDLLEPAAPGGAMPPYLDEQRRSWAQRWPFECIWKARKAA